MKDEKQLHAQDQLSKIFIRTRAFGTHDLCLYQTSLKGYRYAGKEGYKSS